MCAGGCESQAPTVKPGGPDLRPRTMSITGSGRYMLERHKSRINANLGLWGPASCGPRGCSCRAYKDTGMVCYSTRGTIIPGVPGTGKKMFSRVTTFAKDASLLHFEAYLYVYSCPSRFTPHSERRVGWVGLRPDDGRKMQR